MEQEESFYKSIYRIPFSANRKNFEASRSNFNASDQGQRKRSTSILECYFPHIERQQNEIVQRINSRLQETKMANEQRHSRQNVHYRTQPCSTPVEAPEKKKDTVILGRLPIPSLFKYRGSRSVMRCPTPS